MGVVVSVARRAVVAVAIVLAASVAACGDITFAPDAGPTVGAAVPPRADASATPSGATGGPGGHAGPAGTGGTGCATNDDCRGGKLDRCDVATGTCVACLTNDDCDGDRKCAAGKCGPKG